MSASSKKKLRSAQESEKLTEKQMTERKEAKKLNMMTITFVVVIALMLVFAIYTAVSSHMAHSGSNERKTVAVTVGDHEISNAELNYYYVDSINSFLSQYGNAVTMFGLDLSKPLNEQVIDEEKGTTWADNFLEEAKQNVKATYALADAAAKENFQMSEDDKLYVEQTMDSVKFYAKYRGFGSDKEYLKAMYGYGATVDGYRKYVEMTKQAGAFQTAYAESLEYTDADLREAEKENFNAYSSFSYNTYFVTPSMFLEGGTKDDNGNVTYSDEERAAALKAAEEAADALMAQNITSLPDLDKAIAAMEVNKDSETAASTAFNDTPYGQVNSTVRDWVVSSERKFGDVACIPSTFTSTDDDGKEVTNTNGYYIVFYTGADDNTFPLADVRHILVDFEGGTKDDKGNVTFSDEEKAAAKEKAEAILNEWKNGEATEDSFAALAKEKSKDPGSAEKGGLYEDVFPGQMVPSFNDWCFEDGRKAGDTGIVETNYGYHVMFYSADSDLTFRDFQIKNQLMSQDTSKWYTALVDAATVTEVDPQYIDKALVIQPAQ